MKTKSLLLAATLLLGCLLSLAKAQPFTTLYNFTGQSDGSLPQASLLLSGTTLYGTASAGGTSGYNGTVFALNANGADFTNLYNFSAGTTNTTSGLYINNDGTFPVCSLILSGSTLYGTASAGGNSGYGTVFSLSTNGAGFETLYTFTNGSDGSFPLAGLVLSGNTLFGTASQGGASGKGTVFSLNTNGANFSAIYSFTGHGAGSHPQANLLLSGNTLYGTAGGSGGTANGVVFSLNTNGGGFTQLHQFSLTSGNTILTNSDGAGQIGGLIMSGGALYGIASAGGSAGYGTVFSLTTGGLGFTTLYAFTNGSDGANPLGGLVLSGNTLYGTTSTGVNNNYGYAQAGTNGFGAVFSISTNGTNFTSLYAFTGGLDGFDPAAALILSGSTLYGTAYQGGNNAYIGSVFSLSTTAHPLATLLSFNSDPNNFPNGQEPEAGLVLIGNTLYGTADSGGAGGYGSVFSLNTNGTGYPDGTEAIGFSQYDFSSASPFVAPGGINVGTNTGGINPLAGLVLSGNTLYGTASGGGPSGFGTVFSLTTNSVSSGTGFQTLYAFTNGSDGAWPDAGLVLSGSTLYGTTSGTSAEGSTNNGTVFAVNTSGTGFTTLHQFSVPDLNGVNSDGSTPLAGLVLSGSMLYGTAYFGGANGEGTVFAVNTATKIFSTLHSFTAPDINGHNSDGIWPDAGLIISSNTLYGTAKRGGSSGGGTVFSFNLNTSTFKTLHNFTGSMDGAFPEAGLILSGNTLYGTTYGFGVTYGTIFAVPTNGGSFTTLYAFAGGTDGTGPRAGLLLSGNTLYGTADAGGFFIYGTVFALNIGSLSSSGVPVPIALNIQSAGKNVILSWNDPAAVFSLQAGPIFNGGYTNVPNATSPFTTAITASPQFFRLMAPN